MQPYFGGKPAVQYLAQRINGASPEELVSILLEGAQKFLLQAIAAIRVRDIENKARLVNRVSAILEELTLGLNYEDGGELVSNLARIYEWWIRELFAASQKGDIDRLLFIGQQMAEMRGTWNEASLAQHAAHAPTSVTAEGLVG